MGVEKIKAAFENGKKAFIPYVMGGDGGLEQLKERIRFLDEAGASIVEIGIPFSVSSRRRSNYSKSRKTCAT